MQQLNRRIRIAFTQSSDGPRLTLFGPMDVDFTSLHSLFVKLSCGQAHYELHELSFTYAIGAVRVYVQSSGTEQCPGNWQGICEVPSQSGKEFQWRWSGREWEAIAELVASLIKSEIPSHQYLNVGAGEDIIIVLSKGEYIDGVFPCLASP